MAILDPGFVLTLQPMYYPQFMDYFDAARNNLWNIQEISFNTDAAHLRDMSEAEKHIVRRLVAFFATGDQIVANNACLSLYKHVNSPEYRIYLSQQISEEAVHIRFYKTLLDLYIEDPNERSDMYQAIQTIPSVKQKADFCFKWMDAMDGITIIDTDEKKRIFLMNLITFASAVEGLFFFGAFAYVYYLRSRGLLHGLASGTNWVFRDESMHMNVAFEVIDVVRAEYPHLWDDRMKDDIRQMLEEAITCEMQFANDVLDSGVIGLSKTDMLEYLRFNADQRLIRLGIDPVYNAGNPFGFMALQELQENTNFFERTVSAYQVGGLKGEIAFDNEDF